MVWLSTAERGWAEGGPGAAATVARGSATAVGSGAGGDAAAAAPSTRERRA
eukprot:gene49379-15575_t